MHVEDIFLAAMLLVLTLAVLVLAAIETWRWWQERGRR